MALPVNVSWFADQETLKIKKRPKLELGRNSRPVVIFRNLPFTLPCKWTPHKAPPPLFWLLLLASLGGRNRGFPLYQATACHQQHLHPSSLPLALSLETWEALSAELMTLLSVLIQSSISASFSAAIKHAGRSVMRISKQYFPFLVFCAKGSTWSAVRLISDVAPPHSQQKHKDVA